MRPSQCGLFPRPSNTLLVQLVPIPLPAIGVTLAHAPLELLQVAFQLSVIPRKMLQVLANLLIDRLAGSAELFPGALDQLLVNGERDIHEHSICAHVLCVKFMISASEALNVVASVPQTNLRS